MRDLLLILIILFSSILTFSCESGKSLLSGDNDGNYPAIINSLPNEELNKLQNEFDLQNNNKICSRLNKYGLTGRDHCFRNNPKIKIPDDNTALQIAVNTLVENSKFTNIADSAILVNGGFNVSYTSDDSTRWGISFDSQKYQGIEVINSGIVISLFGDGVFNIDGFRYGDIHIPSVDDISESAARDKVTGQKIIWYGFDGEPNEFTVSKDTFGNNIGKVIYPLEKEETIELRVTWKIPIKFGSFIGWHIYLDTTTGETVAIIQEFRT